jgi:SAM-dependent methyltransferase
MSELRQTLRPEYFDAIYSADPDPWKFAASPYERGKYTLTLNVMPKSRYRSALEVGCSIGVLTRLLASRCDAVVAIDAAEAPLVEARRRCADLPGVRFEQIFVPDEWPDGEFDLILLSEVVYYLSREDVGRLAERSDRHASSSARIDIGNFAWTCCRVREPSSRRWASQRRAMTICPGNSAGLSNRRANSGLRSSMRAQAAPNVDSWMMPLTSRAGISSLAAQS